MVRGDGVDGISEEWGLVNDRKEDLLKCAMETKANTSWGRDKWKQLVNAHLQTRERDPLLDWLEGLKAWDGKRRVDSVLEKLFGSTGKLAEWCSRFLFLGIVERATNPGAKLDEVPVLIGPQGVGKSSLLENVLPPVMMAHNCVMLGADEKVLVEASLGKGDIGGVGNARDSQG